MSKSVLQLATEPVIPSEDTVVQWCDDMIARIAGRDAIVRRNPPHRMCVTPGIPDRRYRVYATAVDFEVKAPDGELSDAQIVYLLAELEAGCLAACGGINELGDVLAAIRHEERGDDHEGFALDVCRRIVKAWIAQRDEKHAAIARRKAEREIARQEREQRKAAKAAERHNKRASSRRFLARRHAP